MKKLHKIWPIFLIFFLLVLVFILKGRWSKSIVPETKVATSSSGFSSEIDKAQKEAEEAKKVEEERKRQAEETKKFIATYGPCRNIPILIYHHVADKSGSLYVSTKMFVSQMDYLMQKGYTTVTLVDVMDSLTLGKTLPAKPVVITFDDGYQDMYQNTYPVLISKGLKATFFIITQLVGGSDYLTWDEAREMAGNPLVTMGDHTLSHRALPSLTDSEVRNEISASKTILESNLGVGVNTFAYPYGSYNSEDEKILKEAGFLAAVTTHRGLSCAKLPYELSRVRIGNAAMANFGL